MFLKWSISISNIVAVLWSRRQCSNSFRSSISQCRRLKTPVIPSRVLIISSRCLCSASLTAVRWLSQANSMGYSTSTGNVKPHSTRSGLKTATFPTSGRVTSAESSVNAIPGRNRRQPPEPIIFIPTIITSAAVGNAFIPITPIQSPAIMASILRLKISC